MEGEPDNLADRDHGLSVLVSGKLLEDPSVEECEKCCDIAPEQVQVAIVGAAVGECKECVKLPEVRVNRSNNAVIIYAQGPAPEALPAEATEGQVTEAVEQYRAGLGASQ